MSSQEKPKGDEMRELEFQSLRTQMLENIKIMDQNEIYVLAAIAGVYVLIFQETTSVKLIPYIIWAPFFLTVAGFLRFRALDATIGTINDYLQRMHADGGWVAFYRGQRKPWMRWSREVFWFVTFGVTALFALFVTCRGAFWRS